MATFYESLSPKIEGFKKAGQLPCFFLGINSESNVLVCFSPCHRYLFQMKGLSVISVAASKGIPFGSVVFVAAWRLDAVFHCQTNTCGISFAPCESVYLNIAGTIRYNKEE